MAGDGCSSSNPPTVGQTPHKDSIFKVDHLENFQKANRTQVTIKMNPLNTEPRTWLHSDNDGYYKISTSRTLLSPTFINTAFSSPDMYWATPLPLEDLNLLLDNSVTLGLYLWDHPLPSPATASNPSSPRTPSPTLEAPLQSYPSSQATATAAGASAPGASEQYGETHEQIGMARLVTDGVTTAYLTDVYVGSAWRGRGLGEWLVRCCRELIWAMPALRRAVLMASSTSTTSTTTSTSTNSTSDKRVGSGLRAGTSESRSLGPLEDRGENDAADDYADGDDDFGRGDDQGEEKKEGDGGPAVRFYRKLLDMEVMGRGDGIVAMSYAPRKHATMDLLRS